MKRTSTQLQHVVNGMNRIKEFAYWGKLHMLSGGYNQSTFYSTRFKHLNK